MTDGANTVELEFVRLDAAAMREQAQLFFARMRGRRSVRHFSNEAIPLDVVERCIASAAQAPSGANKQPWTFVLITDRAIKARIREAAEVEERAFYGGRATDRWLRDLEPLGTGPDKPYLEDAPALVAVFAQRHGSTSADRYYYVNESVGIAVGMLLAALHHAGLATLVHTPSPMRFLGEILGRPKREHAYVLIPVGWPAPACRVPAIRRKDLADVLVRV